MRIGQKIKILREKRNLTSENMCEQLAITAKEYAEIESGDMDIPYARLEQIGRVFNLSPEDIMTFNVKKITKLVEIDLIKIRLKWHVNIFIGNVKSYSKLYLTLLTKPCYYGPFKGEIGHLLSHSVPFLSYLHSKGVKIHYCGMEIFKPFLVDEKGNLIVTTYYPLRDFFGEVPPRSNKAIPPADVQQEIEKFKQEAKKKIFIPFWNIDNDFFWFSVHRKWLLKGPYMKTYNLEKVYGNKKEKSVVLCTRKTKTTDFDANLGTPWNYKEIAQAIKPYFTKIYLVGHPSMSDEIEADGSIESCITNDNKIILEKCARSQLIITPRSGINFIGEYTNTKVLIIFNGKGPIKDMDTTLLFRKHVGNKYPLEFAYSTEEIVNYAKNFTF